MKFAINHARAIEGNDIYVNVQANGGKSIASVRTELDGSDLADDELSTPSDFYEHMFPRAGSAAPAPGMQHTLIVNAELADGTAHRSASIWSDPI